MSEELWYPPQPKKYGPWIEHDGGHPELKATWVHILLREERESMQYFSSVCNARYCRWSHVNSSVDIVAYCVKIDQ